MDNNDPVEVLGTIDSTKLKSSMTLFSQVENAHPVFHQVLQKFFGGRMDEKTLTLLG